MTHEEKLIGKRLKALLASGETGHVTVRVEKGRIVGVDHGTGTAVSLLQPSTVAPLETPHMPPLTTRDEHTEKAGTWTGSSDVKTFEVNEEPRG